MDERWIVLLNYWQNVLQRHALTFPFLIGALRTLIGATKIRSNNAIGELKNLIDVMRSHVANEYYCNIYRCPDLEQLVIRKVVYGSPAQSAVAINSSDSSSQASLYVSDGLQKECSSPFESLVDIIWSEVGSDIENGHFSCRGKTFCEFNEYDLKAINRALA